MEWLLGLLGGVVGGGVGGSKNPLGPVVNGGLGAVGGGITGVIIQAATSGGLDFGQILAQVAAWRHRRCGARRSPASPPGPRRARFADTPTHRGRL